jgi:hypothetical protein
MSIEKVKNIALMIRSAFEKISDKENQSKNLRGYCGRASVQIYLECKKVGLSKGLLLCSNDSHAFIVYKGVIVDVTATQFDDTINKVYTDRLSNGRYWFHRIIAIHNDINKCRFTAVHEVKHDSKFVSKK